MKPSLPKGTRDFLPRQMARREYIFSILRKVFRKYGYVPIETPAMENLSVLTGKYGEEGDRLIFKILRSGDFLSKVGDEAAWLQKAHEGSAAFAAEVADKALRYDLTVPFARFVVMNQHELNFPFKRFQIQPVWRADRPQKGRYREFYQCDVDVVGSNSLIYEAEFIAIYDEALAFLGLKKYSILLNNRKILTGIAELSGRKDLFMDICVAIDKLDKIGTEGVKKELAERGLKDDEIAKLWDVLDLKGDNLEKLNALAKLFDGVSEDGLQGVNELKEVLVYHKHLDHFQGDVMFDLSLARGLTYYTGTIYEVRTEEVQMGSIGGGGRYDDLTGMFGVQGLSGAGISFGAERIYDVMEQLGLFEAVDEPPVKVLVVNFGGDEEKAALELTSKLRRSDISAEMYHQSDKFKKQFGFAAKAGIPWVVIQGANELEQGLVVLKDMKTGSQESVTFEEAVVKVK